MGRIEQRMDGWIRAARCQESTRKWYCCEVRELETISRLTHLDPSLNNHNLTRPSSSLKFPQSQRRVTSPLQDDENGCDSIFVQGGPSASGKVYVDIKFKVPSLT